MKGNGSIALLLSATALVVSFLGAAAYGDAAQIGGSERATSPTALAPQAKRGPRGPRGFRGQPGPRGPKGDKGDRGDPGPGPVDSATAESVNPGDPAEAIFDPATRRLHFKIPRGLKGDRGDPGAPGADGLDGLDGLDGKDGKDGLGFVRAENGDLVADNPGHEFIFNSGSFDVFTDLLLIGTDKGRLVIQDDGRITLLSRRPEDDVTASSLHLNPNGSIDLGNSSNRLFMDTDGTMRVTKDTKVENLNADKVDGKDAADFGTGFQRAPNGDLLIENLLGEFLFDGGSFHVATPNGYIDLLQSGRINLATKDGAGNFIGMAANPDGTTFNGATRADGTFVGTVTRTDGQVTTGAHDGDGNLTTGIDVDGAGIPLVDRLSIGDDRTTSADVFQQPLTDDLIFENGDSEFVFNGGSFHVNAPVAELNSEPILAGKVAVSDLASATQARLQPDSCTEGQFSRFMGSQWACSDGTGGGGTATDVNCTANPCVDVTELRNTCTAGKVIKSTGTSFACGDNSPTFPWLTSYAGTSTSWTHFQYNATSAVSLINNGPTDGAGTKTGFLIEHPFDRELQLAHTPVESHEQTNIYSGNVRTNRRGFAVVKLPQLALSGREPALA